MAAQIWTGAEEELTMERDQIHSQGLELMSELREVYTEKPDWLRLRDMHISRHIPVNYIREDDWIGRGYVAMEPVDDQCVVYGSFDFVHTRNLFRLGIDQAAVPAFCSKLAVAGVRPRFTEM